MFIGSLNLWAMMGAFGAQYVSDTRGRKSTFVLAAVGIITGIFVTIVSPSYPVLMIGRLLVGMGVGIGFAVDPLYIAEITPPANRGELVTWSEIAVNVGIVCGFSTGLLLHGFQWEASTEWRVMLLLGCIMPLLMIVLVATGIVPESPRWLVANHRQEEARCILSQIYPPGYDITRIIQDIQGAIERDAAAEKAIGWAVLLRPTPAFASMLWVGVGIAMAQQAVGIDAIQYYLLHIIEQTGVESPQEQSLILVYMGITKLVFVIIGGRCFDQRGRRPLLFLSLLGMYISLGIVALAKLSPSSSSSNNPQLQESTQVVLSSTHAQLFGMALYLASFSIGMGPGAWLIPSEIFSISIRAKAMSLATALNRAVATVLSCTFLSTIHFLGLGPFCCLLAIICVVVLVFLYIYLPETKGRSLEEMSLYFAQLTGDQSVVEAEAELSLRTTTQRRDDANDNITNNNNNNVHLFHPQRPPQSIAS